MPGLLPASPRLVLVDQPAVLHHERLLLLLQLQLGALLVLHGLVPQLRVHPALRLHARRREPWNAHARRTQLLQVVARKATVRGSYGTVSSQPPGPCPMTTRCWPTAAVQCAAVPGVIALYARAMLGGNWSITRPTTA